MTRLIATTLAALLLIALALSPSLTGAAAYTKCKADETLVEWAHDDERRRRGDVGGYDCLAGGVVTFSEHYLSRHTPAHPVAQRSAPRLVDDAPGHRFLVFGSGECGGWEPDAGVDGSGWYVYVEGPC